MIITQCNLCEFIPIWMFLLILAAFVYHLIWIANPAVLGNYLHLILELPLSFKVPALLWWYFKARHDTTSNH